MHGAFPSTFEADDVVKRAVDFDHAVHRIAGTLVETIDILRDQSVKFSAAFEFG